MSQGEYVARTKLNIQLVHLKVGDSEQLLILPLKRPEAADLSEVGIVFETDERSSPRLRAKLARMGQGLVVFQSITRALALVTHLIA